MAHLGSMWANVLGRREIGPLRARAQTQSQASRAGDRRLPARRRRRGLRARPGRGRRRSAPQGEAKAQEEAEAPLPLLRHQPKQRHPLARGVRPDESGRHPQLSRPARLERGLAAVREPAQLELLRPPGLPRRQGRPQRPPGHLLDAFLAGRSSKTLPINTEPQRNAWSAFLREAVKRYGPHGEFWKLRLPDPALPADPRLADLERGERHWYTEPVSVSGYAKLLKISSRAIKQADRGATVVMGGLYGRPQLPKTLPATTFLQRLYRSRAPSRASMRSGLHPYAKSLGASGQSSASARS